jgi:hypothetical protein
MLLLTGTFFTIGSGDITTMLGYTGQLVGDLMPLIVLFVGLTIAFQIYKHFKK